jgi:hypothetical protein
MGRSLHRILDGLLRQITLTLLCFDHKILWRKRMSTSTDEGFIAPSTGLGVLLYESKRNKRKMKCGWSWRAPISYIDSAALVVLTLHASSKYLPLQDVLVVPFVLAYQFYH